MERTFEVRCTAFVVGVALTLYLSAVTSAPVKAPVPHADPDENVADPNDVDVSMCDEKVCRISFISIPDYIQKCPK